MCRKIVVLIMLLSGMSALAGCSIEDTTATSGQTTSAPSLTPSVPINTFDAPHGPLPQVQFNGGRVMSNPRFMAITFPADSFAPSINMFMSKFASSPQWTAMTSEYGVNAASVAAPVQLTEGAPGTIDDTQIQTWLSAKFNTVSRPLGAPDTNTIYIINYPPTTSITASGQASCSDFDGYHSEFTDPASGTAIVYAVIANCSGYTINDQTSTMSHELVEAVTDPDNNPAYYGVAQDFAVWNTVSYGSEVGDMCQDYNNSYFVPSNIGFQIQRSWSNAAAAAGNDPCVPAATGQTYVNASPGVSDSITYNDNGQSTTGTGISIPVGQSRVIELDLFSSAQTAAWKVSASEFSSSGHLGFSFNTTTGTNGSKIYLTVTVHSKDTTFNAEPFWVISTLNGVSHYWPVIVGN